MLNKTDEQILTALARAVEGLWFMSESDYPFETVRLDMTDEPGPESLRELAGAEGNVSVEMRQVEEFFREGAAVRVTGEGPNKTAGPASFADVVRVLKENLADIRVYRVGEINIPVYVIGRSGSGTWMGLQTRVVET